MPNGLDTYKSTLTGPELDAALRNIALVQENVSAAAASAEAAAKSVEEAKIAVQQAGGFRTFFSAISPDEAGTVDPSRPMTTAAAQASWTVKSKGDRIQSVQVNGFTSGAGLYMNVAVFDGSSDEQWTLTGTSSGQTPFFTCNNGLTGNSQLATVFSERYRQENVQPNNSLQGISSWNNILYLRDSSIKDTNDLRAKLKQRPLTVWYVPNGSIGAAIYLPVYLYGHLYRCQCLPLAEQLVNGSNVQSNVSSGCDKKIVFDASNLQGWSQDATDDPEKYRYIYKLPGALVADASEEYKRNAYSDTFKVLAGGRTYYLEKGFTINAQFGNLYVYDEGESLSEWKEKVSSNPFTLFYKSVNYAGNDLPVSLETHTNGDVYAHDPIELVAVPYTAIDTSHTPGTYDVSSQNGTTVQVSLKAMQDGGNAATLDGHTWADIQKLISDAVASAVALSK